MSNSKNKNILIKMTGSIACFKACALISKLVQAGHHVKVVASPSALKFIGVATLEGLTGEKVLTDLWESGQAMAHIHLMRWADLIAVIPASAHFINRIGYGVGDDLLTTLFLAHDFKKPYLIAPAMNTSMYLHPTTQQSIARLKEMGLEILESASGVLACGEVGYGRLIEPGPLQEEIEKRLNSALSDSSKKSGTAVALPKILITSGGTQEPIDSVRMITNVSTGATGAELTDRLESLGFSIVLVHAKTALLPESSCEKIAFQTSQDLRSALSIRLSRGDVGAVIHLAAVSDFILSDWEQDGIKHLGADSGKISSQSELTLHFKKNVKILEEIRSLSPRPLHLTAFKLTSHASMDQRDVAIKSIFKSRPDWVVLNDLSEIDKIKGQHGMTLFHKDSKIGLPLASPAGLVENLAIEYANLWNQKERFL